VAQAAASALPDNAEVMAALGRMQLLSGDSNQAVATLAKLAARESQSAQVHLLLADAYVHTEDLAAAEKAYRRALEVSPGLAEAQRGLIAISVRTKNPARALEAARAMQRGQPELGVGYLLEGDVHRQFNDWDAAVRAYRAGLAKGNFVGLSERLYTALAKAKGKAEAQQFADDWIKRHPEDAGLAFFLGNQAMTEGNLATAERHFAAAHATAPRLLGPLNNLAWVRAKLGKPDGVTLAQQALALAPDDANTLDTLVFALMQAQRQPEALDAVKAAVARAPRHLPHRYLLARTLADTGDKAGARAEIDQLAAKDAGFAARPEVVALRARVAN
jgi:tetratricopeptide (TPR) repeat protein